MSKELKEAKMAIQAIRHIVKDPSLAILVLEQVDGRRSNTGPRVTSPKVARNKWVRNLNTRGFSKSLISQKVGVTPGTVANILAS